jgi:hypothetical protein
MPAERTQSPLDGEIREQWLGVVQRTAAETAGPAFTARESSDCPRCPARTACPLTDSGRQVTS